MGESVVPTVAGPSVLASFKVPRKPLDPDNRAPYARADYRQWVRFVRAYADLATVAPVDVPCRVVATVYVARCATVSLQAWHIEAMRRGLERGLVDAGIITDPRLIESVEVRHVGLPISSPDTRTEIEIHAMD